MLRPLKIVHVCRIGWPHLGGMESVVGGLAASLSAAGHDVRVVTLDRAITTGERLPRGIWGGVHYSRLRRVGPRRYPAALHLTSALRGADIVHVHGVDGLLHQALAGRSIHGAKVGLTPHGGFLHTRRNSWVKQGWLRTGAAAALRGADAVWFTSEADRQALSASGVDGQVLTNGVNVEGFSSIRRRPEPGRWLVVGRVDVHKGLDDLLVRLAALAQHDARPFQLRVVGPQTATGLVPRLMAQAQRLGIRHRVQFLGPVSDAGLRAEFGRCELALFPSRYEGFGVAVVEAMAAGVPVVVNDIPPFQELVRDGENGFVVPFSSGSGRRKLYEIRENAEAMSEPARAAATRHSWTARVHEWVRVYSDLVAS